MKKGIYYILLAALTGLTIAIGCEKGVTPPNPNMPDGTVNPLFFTDVTDNLISTDKEGGSYTVGVTQNTAYKWSVSSNESWVTVNVSSDERIEGSGSVTISVAAYEEVDPRSATVTIQEVEPKNNRTITLKIEQSGAEPSIEVDIASIETEALGGSYDVEVITNGATWTASSDVSWISVTPSSGKTQTAVVTVNKNVNSETPVRTGIVTFASGSVHKTVTVTQEGFTTCHSAGNEEVVYFDEFAPCEDSQPGDEWSLTDRRDDKIYTVKLMPDGRYWMIEDLRFGGTPDIGEDKNTFSTDDPSKATPAGEHIPEFFGDVVNITFNGSSDIEPRPGRGYFYNWRAAMQKADVSTGSSYSEDQGIAPAGWHIPSVEEFTDLRDAIGIDGKRWGEGADSEWKGIWGGDIDGGTRRNWGLGAYGYYWTSTNKMVVDPSAAGMGDHQAVVWRINNPTTDADNVNIYIEDNPQGVAEPAKKNKNGGALVRCIRNY